MSAIAPVLFIPHGGGPLPLLGDPRHAALVRFLTEITPSMDRPAAIVVVSAHWESGLPTITSGSAPSLIHDYSGFPPESYRIRYPAPGAPELASRIVHLLNDSGIDARLDGGRGFDHGVYVPLKLMYPDAGIPCIQLSLVCGLDPELHVRIGEALSALRQEQVLVIGSGFSFHNLRAFRFRGEPEPDPMNAAFEDWLLETCTSGDLPEAERRRRLTGWTEAPHARYCHPREEHLLPLHVCYGVAGTAARRVFDGTILGKRASAYLW